MNIFLAYLLAEDQLYFELVKGVYHNLDLQLLDTYMINSVICIHNFQRFYFQYLIFQ